MSNRIYTIEQLREIHTDKKAVFNILYKTRDKIFIGTIDKRLVEVTNKISIEQNSSSIVNNSSSIIELENIKADKCFSIAMSIAL